MRRTIGILFLTIIGLGLLDLTPAEVTHDEIRGTIQSLIYSYNQLDNKLERHEHRERALGEIMKKAMQSLQKGQKSLEPINGIFGRLDERVSQIETMLITQEEKYNIQSEKFGETLEHMFKWMRENDECYKRPPVSAIVAPAAPAVPPEFVKQQEQINKELLAEIRQLSANVAKLLDTSKNMMEQSEVAFKSMPNTADMLTKIEDKLVSYTIAPTVTAPPPIDNTIFENKVFEKFIEVTNGISELKALPKPDVGLTSTDREFIHGLTNETLSALQAVKSENKQAVDSVLSKATDSCKEVETKLGENMKQILMGVTNSGEILGKFYNEMNATYSQMSEGLEIFSKFNNILMTNSEYVLDTQRKVEFGTLQIVQKIGALMEKQDEELVAMLKERFNNIDESIVSTQTETVKNITALIDAEIEQVWRRIEIMTGEITDTAELLKLMQSGHEGYVNSTFGAMLSMSAKVEETKVKMIDMNSDLNFLIGRLSLMTQEFGNIKIGLAKSLDDMRTTFHSMQERMPNNIGNAPQSRHQYDTELNLLNKRHSEVN